MIIDGHSHTFGSYLTTDGILKALDETGVDKVVLVPGELNSKAEYSLRGEKQSMEEHRPDDMILIRAARPNMQEGLVYARFLNEASEGFFEKMLGSKSSEIIAEAYVKPNNEFSFEHATMIEYNGRIVGMASGFTSTEKEGFKQKILSEYPHGSRFRIRMFSVIGKWLSRYMGPRGKEEYYLETIAVSAEMRGKGLGQRLLGHAVDTAIGKGAKVLALDVSSKNNKAIGSYKKFGMEIASVWPDFLKLPSVFTRMEKELLTKYKEHDN